MTGILKYIKDRLLLTSLRSALFGRAAAEDEELRSLRKANHDLAVSLSQAQTELALVEKSQQGFEASVAKSIADMKATYEKSLEVERELVDRYRVAHAKLALATRAPFEARETDGAPPFDEDDRTRWREFLATPTGKRLMQSLNWWSQYEEQAATLRNDKHEYACGSTSGFRRCAQFAIHKLSADTRLQQGEDTRAQNGASDLRERIAP